MRPIDKLRHLLETHGIYRQAVNLMREHRRLQASRLSEGVHIREPDRFNGFKWEAYVEDRHGAETASAAFDTEQEAMAQARKWQAQMDQSGMNIGSPVGASYER